VLLATLSVRGISQGTSALALGVTGPDLTEGFALDPAGFAEVQLVGGSVGIVPEPASGLLLAAALGLLAASRRCAH
jgi:hypothetical protein